ncbi:hypothetical protein Tco_0454004 [Tanacetum coccineum]
MVSSVSSRKIGNVILLSSDVTSKEATLQVVYDVLKLTPFYKAFQVTADGSTFLNFALSRLYRSIEDHLLRRVLAFLASLGHSGDIRKITDVNVNKLHQPWRSFAAIINKCLSGKPSYDSLRLSQAQSYGAYRSTFVNGIRSFNSLKKQGSIGLCQEQFLQRQNEARRKLIQIQSLNRSLPLPPKKRSLEKESRRLQSWRYSQADLTEAEQLKIITKEAARNTQFLPDDEDDDEHDDVKKAQDDDDEEQTESEDDGDDFVHPKLTTHDNDIIHERGNCDIEVEGNEMLKSKVDEEATYEEHEGKMAVEVTIQIFDGRDDVMIDVIFTQVQATQELKTLCALTRVNPVYGTTELVPSGSHFFMHNPIALSKHTKGVRILEDNFSKLRQTNQYAEALSSIPGIVDQYLANKMQEAVDVAVQLKYDRIREESNTAINIAFDSHR